MKFYQVYKNVSPLQMATSYMRRAAYCPEAEPPSATLPIAIGMSP